MLAEDCKITSGDDAIAVKAGSGTPGGNADYAHAFEKRLGHGSENMLFQRITINHRWPTIGSNCAGHIRNLTFRDMTVGDGANHLSGLFIKTYSGNGGMIEDITWENIDIKGKVGEWNLVASAPLRVTMLYHTSRECNLPCPVTGCMCHGQKPKIRNIVFRNIRALTTQPYPSKIRGSTGPLTAGIFYGLPGSPIDGLTLDNVTVVDPNPDNAPYSMVGWNCTNAINVITKSVAPPWPTGTCSRPSVAPRLKTDDYSNPVRAWPWSWEALQPFDYGNNMTGFDNAKQLRSKSRFSLLFTDGGEDYGYAPDKDWRWAEERQMSDQVAAYAYADGSPSFLYRPETRIPKSFTQAKCENDSDKASWWLRDPMTGKPQPLWLNVSVPAASDFWVKEIVGGQFGVEDPNAAGIFVDFGNTQACRVSNWSSLASRKTLFNDTVLAWRRAAVDLNRNGKVLIVSMRDHFKNTSNLSSDGHTLSTCPYPEDVIFDLMQGTFWAAHREFHPTEPTRSPDDCARDIMDFAAEAQGAAASLWCTYDLTNGTYGIPCTGHCPNFNVSLAMFMLGAEQHSYFGASAGYSDAPVDQWTWWPAFDHRLGKPTGRFVQDGPYKFSREFEHAAVSVDCQTNVSHIEWSVPNVVEWPPSFVTFETDWPAFLRRHDMMWRFNESKSTWPSTFETAAWTGNGVYGLSPMFVDGSLRFEIGRTDVWSCGYAPRLPIGHLRLTPRGEIVQGTMNQSLYEAAVRGSITTSAGVITFRVYSAATAPLSVLEWSATGGEAGSGGAVLELVNENAIGRNMYGHDQINPPARCSKSFSLGSAGLESFCVQQLVCGGARGANVTSALRELSIDGGRSLAFVSVGSFQPAAQMHPRASGAVDSLEEATSKVRSVATAEDEAALWALHKESWRMFWGRNSQDSFLSIPDTRLESMYWITQAKLRGALSSEAAPATIADQLGPYRMDMTMSPSPRDLASNGAHSLPSRGCQSSPRAPGPRPRPRPRPSPHRKVSVRRRRQALPGWGCGLIGTSKRTTGAWPARIMSSYTMARPALRLRSWVVFKLPPKLG